MKKALVVIVVVLMASAALVASITLNSSAQQTTTVVTQAGTVTDTADTAAATSMQVDWAANRVAVTYSKGSGGNAFSASGFAAGVTVYLDLSTGNWSTGGARNGRGGSAGQSGTLSAGALTSFKNTLNGLRNSAENFAINQSILPGTQNAW